MFQSSAIIVVILCYIGFLFLLAQWVERKSASGQRIGNHPLIYSLSLAIYCTSWTYYGSVGSAATSGFLFLTIYLGPTLVIVLWWHVLRKLIRLKNSHHITSIADFIAARYGKSQLLAALATMIALVGIIPYIALQLKAVISTFAIITSRQNTGFFWIGSNVGPIVVLLMILFTIIFGVRRLDATERHQGMVVVVALESLVKLLTFLAVGIFVTYFVFDGFADIFQKIQLNAMAQTDPSLPQASSPSPLTWVTYLLLSMSAILFLPRQFHISVVENSDEKHIRTAMWLFPLYMFLINIFVYPIAKGCLLAGLPVADADTFVLKMPLHFGQSWLALLVFIGGFSAATSMIMISSMTLATMVTNHLFLPTADWAKGLNFLRRHLLKARWAAVALIIISGYWFETIVGSSFSLVRMGILSFAAVLQFAPSILGGIFWRRGNRMGAIFGLTSGFLVWGYTVIIPSFVNSGALPSSLLTQGPWGIGLLNPERLFGLGGLEALPHSVLWSMFFNVGLYVLGSLFFETSAEEKRQADHFVDVFALKTAQDHDVRQLSHIDFSAKKIMLHSLLSQYFPEAAAKKILHGCLSRIKVNDGREKISVLELADICTEVEKSLAGTIGTAAAHTALKRKEIFSPPETKALQEAYSEIIAGLSLTPADLKRKVDYYREREQLIKTHAYELEDQLEVLEEQIKQRQKTEKELRQSEGRLQAIMDNSAAVIYLKDTTGRYVLINLQFSRLFGLSAAEVCGKTDYELFSDEIANQFWAHDRQALTEKRHCQMEEEILVQDRTLHYLSVKFPLYDDKNTIYGICGIATDVTALKKAHDQLRRLSGSIMAEQEKERGAVARELHDELGQVLTALRLDSVWLHGHLRQQDEKAADRAGAMCALIDRTISEVRNMAVRLRPGVLDDLGLVDALEWLATDFEKRNNSSCTFMHDQVPPVSDVIATAAYRITQEALTNVTRHAGASEVEISFRFNAGALTLAIVDNGQGFDMDILEESKGLGITGMQERANLINGNVSIKARPGQGTSVFLQVPVQMVQGVLS